MSLPGVHNPYYRVIQRSSQTDYAQPRYQVLPPLAYLPSYIPMDRSASPRATSEPSEPKLEHLSERIEALASQADAQRSCISALENQLTMAQLGGPGRTEANNHQTNDQFQDEYRKLSADLKKYQSKCDAYKHSKEELQMKLETADREKRNMALDLEESRRYANSVEETKSRIERQLQDRVDEVEQLKAKTTAAEKALISVKLDCSNESQRADKLQQCLSAVQESLVSRDLELKKREKELTVALDQLEACETKLGVANAEAGRLRSRNDQLETEMRRLRMEAKSEVYIPQMRKMGDTRQRFACRHNPNCVNIRVPHEPQFCRPASSKSECRSRQPCDRNGLHNTSSPADKHCEVAEIKKLLENSNSETKSIMELIKIIDRWRFLDEKANN